MRQMMIPLEMQVEIDYAYTGFPELLKKLKPVVWEEGMNYCCLLGPDLNSGVLGYGGSVKDAVADWAFNIRERLSNHQNGDEVANFINASLEGTQNYISMNSQSAA